MYLYRHRRWAWIWTTTTVATSVMVVLNSAIYFPTGPTPAFFVEKGSLRHDPLWLAAFYFHVVGASVCLLAGIPASFPRLLRPPWIKLHRAFGYIYFNAVLWAAAPSGLILAATAKGGAAGAIGFAVAGVLWWWTTWAGYLAIRRGDIPTHVRMMVRSYALALSAPAFRLWQAGFSFTGLDNQSNYVISLWLSVATSLWLSETCIRHRLGKSAPTPPVARDQGVLA